MSMSDCTKCWDTPCTCGYDYRNWSVKRLAAHIAMLQWVMACQEAEAAGRKAPDNLGCDWAKWKMGDQAAGRGVQNET